MKKCYGDGIIGCDLTDLLFVGTKPAGDGRWGQSDLAGNVWEWVLDWYSNGYVQNPCNDCANLASGAFRVLRGAGDGNTSDVLRTGYRGRNNNNYRHNDTGVRCARPP
jgi:formylglycine-generating enzyme required for sulfatase activity